MKSASQRETGATFKSFPDVVNTLGYRFHTDNSTGGVSLKTCLGHGRAERPIKEV